MADPVIGATIQVTLETALSLASDRIGMLVGFKKDLASMTRSLRFINARLSDAEEKQQNQDRVVHEWLKCLEEVAYDAQNVLDELHYESLRHQVESRNRHKLKLKEINQQARDFGLEVSQSCLLPSLLLLLLEAREVGRPTLLLLQWLEEPMMKSEIVKILLSLSEKVVSVLPKVGMGGLGKTTLAKSIYNNKQIDEHFDIKIWVCVSKKVPIEELFKLILVHLTKEKVEVDLRDVIVEKIGNNPGGKRYLLVLDDVWNDDQALWEDFFNTLKGLNPTNGSWCLVTTRPGPVAQCVSRVFMMENEAYRLGKLPDATAR
nr:putative disease resistance protein RGA3 [Coffea arabica]